MKVVFLAPYADGTGYSKSAIQYILSLDKVGVTVVPRSCKMTNTKGEVPRRITELEDNDLNNVDCVIQHNLPNEFVYKSGVKNIGSFYYETDGFPNSSWKQNLELMDGIFVASRSQKKMIENTCPNLSEKTHVIPQPLDGDLNRYSVDTMDFSLPMNTLKFYTISEMGRRKNLAALLVAYYSKFSSDDNVVLVVKTHDPGRNGEYTRGKIKAMVNDIKTSLNRFVDPSRYPPVIILTQYMTESQICSLHRSCHIFVSASHGEGWCIPAVDALSFGNFVIAPKCGAFLDYIDPTDLSNGFLVDGVESTVTGVENCLPGLYTSDEKWFNVNIDALGSTMKTCYAGAENIVTLEKASKRLRYINDKYSYGVVGEQLKNMIESVNAV